MAKSESHTLGEFIGNFFEDLMKEPIREFANNNNLYFDSVGPRQARPTNFVTWEDINGSKHNLDYVLEKGGTATTFGTPVAFIELAWRRYTKHSKNKAQEISGAVNPICKRFELFKPFKGAILSGLFTKNSLDQLKKDNFSVLYVPFQKLVDAFAKCGLDIYYDEDTPDERTEELYNEIISPRNKEKLDKVRSELLTSFDAEIKSFVAELSASYNRKVKRICIMPLHGARVEMQDIDSAISYIEEYKKMPENSKLEYIEIIITYNNGSLIQCQFKDKLQAVEFLKTL